jgi:transposase
MSDEMLFPIGPRRPAQQPQCAGNPRLRYAVRNQVELIQTDLDSTLSDDHFARIVWSYVEQANLWAFYETIRAVDNHPGRPAIDPRILLALWLYATIDAVGSARELDRLCQDHVAYRWLCGGVSLNYHTLADFRASHAADLEKK